MRASREASFEYSRYAGNKGPLGTMFAPDLAIEQLEVLTSQQVRSVREYSVSYRSLRAGSWAANGAETADALEQLGDGLRSIFKKK